MVEQVKRKGKVPKVEEVKVDRIPTPPKVKQLIKFTVAKYNMNGLARTMEVRHRATLKAETPNIVIYEGPDTIIEITKV